MEKRIKTERLHEVMDSLEIGDKVLLSGVLYTGRDAAHKKMIDAINKGEQLPFDVKNQSMYYVGPCPAKEGEVIGSAGPTTSYRMDDYTPQLLDRGLKGMIGKGIRNQAVIDSMIKNGAVYFVAIGGAAAVIAQSIKTSEVIAYEELGTEAVRRIEVEDMPVFVAIDCKGNNIYNRG
jgi:fumarate hydratase subunit beta